MALEEQIVRLMKETYEDLVNLRFDKLKKESKINNETEVLLKEVVAMQGTLTLPPSDEEMDIGVYEYNDNSGFGAEISYLWFDGEEIPLTLFLK